MNVESIAAFSTAYSQAKVQTEVGYKVMRLSNDQAQATAQLLSDTMENLQESIEQFAGGALDTYA